MNAERIKAFPLTQAQALEYAQIAVRQKLGKPAEKVRSLGGGSFGRAVSVLCKDGQTLVVKFLLAEDMMQKEVHDLELLAGYSPVRVPRVFFARPGDEKIPVDCYGMEQIEGKSSLFALGMLFLGKRRRREFADRVTTALHAIHSCKRDTFGDTMDAGCERWLDYYRPFAEEVLNKAEAYHAAGKLKKKVILAMRAAWEKFDVIFSEEVKEACLIHGDLNVGNIMVGRGYRITGFIDPLNSAYADREYDLFQFDNLTGKRFFLRETYLKKNGASRYCMPKLAFYGVWNEVFCYIRSGVYVGFIMDPLVKNLNKRLKEL